MITYMKPTYTTTNSDFQLYADLNAVFVEHFLDYDVGNGYSKLINRKSGKALDSDGTTADGDQLIQWTDNGGDNQKWQLME